MNRALLEIQDLQNDLDYSFRVTTVDGDGAATKGASRDRQASYASVASAARVFRPRCTLALECR